MMRSKRARTAASTPAMYPNASATSRHASVSRADPSAVWYLTCLSLPRDPMPSDMLSTTLDAALLICRHRSLSLFSMRYAGGFAIPIVFFAGFRAPPVVATLGAGLNALTIDRLDDDTGVGVLSPRADLRLGLDFGGVFVLATSDVQRRWMWGRDDITLLQAGLALGVGPPFRRPETARR